MKPLALLLALAATPAIANEADKMLQSLKPDMQAFALGHSVTTSGDSCPNPSRPFRMGIDKKGTATWSVACANGKSYAVSIYSDAKGSSKVLNCGVLKMMSKVECFQKF